jgi:hypothetical protein
MASVCQRWLDLVEHRQFCHSWLHRDERRISAMDIIFFILMIAAIIAALSPHHRRTYSLPHAPFGSDVETDRDLPRILHDAPPTS